MVFARRTSPMVHIALDPIACSWSSMVEVFAEREEANCCEFRISNCITSVKYQKLIWCLSE